MSLYDVTEIAFYVTLCPLETKAYTHCLQSDYDHRSVTEI